MWKLLFVLVTLYSAIHDLVAFSSCSWQRVELMRSDRYIFAWRSWFRYRRFYVRLFSPRYRVHTHKRANEWCTSMKQRNAICAREEHILVGLKAREQRMYFGFRTFETERFLGPYRPMRSQVSSMKTGGFVRLGLFTSFTMHITLYVTVIRSQCGDVN